ncbi:MAG: flagellin [Leptolyngbya sp. PLA3]|nr:MAG: flagellin [Cyanobacteria bacterium CYA]MCE7968068.1 flagellin [Leptolyngbya sp. PL-A3]
MARINTNVSSIVAQANLRRSSNELDLRLQRLSTGLRINRGKDDPAGMIISERITTDLAGIEQGIKNGDRAASVIATTEAALTEVADLLNTIKALMVEAANTGANSPAERDANQLQIDSAIQSITRISNTASFGGLKLLNGNLDYVTSGIAASAITKAQIFSASFIDNQAVEVEVDTVASAQTAGLFLNGLWGAGAPYGNGALQSTTTIRVEGSRGVQELTFTSGATYSDIVAAVNSRTALTGVTAELLTNGAASGLVFRSEKYGSNEFVSVDRVGGPSDEDDDGWQLYKIADNAQWIDDSGGFNWASRITAGDLVEATRDTGQDVRALVNGTLATGRGLTVSVNGTSLSLELDLHEDLATQPNATPTVFNITEGGSLFQLGPQISALQQVSIGVGSVAAEKLGGTLAGGSVFFLSSLMKGQANSIEENIRNGDFTSASDILDNAIEEVSKLRGRLGAFERNVLETNSRSLQAAFENLTASQSQIRDADFALETSRLTRAQILQQSGMTILGLANQQSQSVLQLLG